MIEDAWNYTAEQLKAWAFTETKTIPDQDWELSVASSGYDSLVLELAQDSNCPNHKFMLVCLYMMVGDLLHCSPSKEREQELISLANEGLNSKSPSVAKWANKTVNIINKPENFLYDEWCWLSENDV